MVIVSVEVAVSTERFDCSHANAVEEINKKVIFGMQPL